MEFAMFALARNRLLLVAICSAGVPGATATGGVAPAADKAAPKRGADPAKLQAARSRGLEFLRTTQQEDGSWTSSTAPGVSGLVTAAILQSGIATDDPMARKA